MDNGAVWSLRVDRDCQEKNTAARCTSTTRKREEKLVSQNLQTNKGERRTAGSARADRVHPENPNEKR